ncbi:MAG TPA: hypothetical protein VHI13_10455 [Candidatus Kapabacteria bacterium]|nr:hypothetical protein [Candidatus Kapabacteria bacterium]
MPHVFQRLLHLASPHLLKPSHIGLLASDLLRIHGPVHETTVHLRAVMNWLFRSCGCLHLEGSSAGYSITDGWRPAYPETTGYIIPTLLRYQRYAGEDRFRSLALTLADWESAIQLPCGAVRGGYHGRDPFGVFKRSDVPVVFNTGMVLLGWTRALRETESAQTRRSLIDAADWLVRMQEPDGSWSRGHSEATSATSYSYYTMVAWSLAEAWSVTGCDAYRAAACRFVEWVLSLQAPNGFIPHMSFSDDAPPVLHTICYTLQGLIECGMRLGREDCVEAAVKPAERLMRAFERHGRLHGHYNERWEPEGEYSCVTGEAQLSIVLTSLARIKDDLRYFNTALKINDNLKRQQPMRTGNPDMRGGVRGSLPVWGEYSRLNFPNWAAKFYADALLEEETYMNQLMFRISSEAGTRPRADA